MIRGDYFGGSSHMPGPPVVDDSKILGTNMMDDFSEDDPGFYLVIMVLLVLSFGMFLVESHPRKGGYVANHYSFDEELPDENESFDVYGYIYYSLPPAYAMIWQHLTLGSIIDWCLRTDQPEAKSRPIFIIFRILYYVAVPFIYTLKIVFRRQLKEDIAQEDLKQYSYEGKYPPEILEATTGLKIDTYAGYFNLLIRAVIKENLWYIQSILNMEPGVGYWAHKEGGWLENYLQHAYKPIEGCFHNIINSAPDAKVSVVLRDRNEFFFQPWEEFKITGKSRDCINLASYNYLGFGGLDPTCTAAVEKVLYQYGLSTGSHMSAGEDGRGELHQALESTMAKFLNKEDALVFGMGFATNSCFMPLLLDKDGDASDCLIISDQLNHRSIVEGVRLTGAQIQSFKHNDMVDLEKILKKETAKTEKPWRKILLVVEGIYSMEGDFCRLREIVGLKDKYGVLLYLDEAHSIGGIGADGKGVCQLLNVPTERVDVMMGTFTKSFGSAGGYIAGKRGVIENLRKRSAGAVYGASMSPVCTAQALAAFHVIEYSSFKMEAIKENANYFRTKLIEMGYWVLGDYDSPVMCCVICHPRKLGFYGKACLDAGLACVVVGFPATPFLYTRVRFCLSAAHTRTELDIALDKLKRIGSDLGLLYKRHEPAEQAIKERWDYNEWLKTASMDLEPVKPYPNFEYLASDESDITKTTPYPRDANFDRWGMIKRSSVADADHGEDELSQIIGELEGHVLAAEEFEKANFDDPVFEKREKSKDEISMERRSNSHSRVESTGPIVPTGSTPTALGRLSTSNIDEAVKLTYTNREFLVKKKVEICEFMAHMGAPEAKTAPKLANFRILDPLGIVQAPPKRCLSIARNEIWKNGFGMCGPRGFFGTSMDHLRLEQLVAQQFDHEEAIFYSHGVTAASSVIPALPVAGDLVCCDIRSNYGIKSGMRLLPKGTTVKWFSSVNELRDILTKAKKIIRQKNEIEEPVSKSKKKEDKRKVFIVSEGLFQHDGSVCDLPALVVLKQRVRNGYLVIDDSIGFGALGERGVLDYYGYTKNYDDQMEMHAIDFYIGGLETAVGSIGAFCSCPKLFRLALRLSSSGYCFSASAPAMSCIWSMEVIRKHLTKRLVEVEEWVWLKKLGNDFRNELKNLDPKFEVTGDHYVTHIRGPGIEELAESKNLYVWRAPANEGAIDKRLGILELTTKEKYYKPSLRIAVSTLHTPEEVKAEANRIRALLQSM